MDLRSCTFEAGFSSEKPKKVKVAISEEKIQERPEGEAGSSSHFLAGKCPNRGRDSISCCQKIGKYYFSSSVEILPEKQGISDSHSLLGFSDWLDLKRRNARDDFSQDFEAKC